MIISSLEALRQLYESSPLMLFPVAIGLALCMIAALCLVYLIAETLVKAVKKLIKKVKNKRATKRTKLEFISEDTLSIDLPIDTTKVDRIVLGNPSTHLASVFYLSKAEQRSS